MFFVSTDPGNVGNFPMFPPPMMPAYGASNLGANPMANPMINPNVNPIPTLPLPPGSVNYPRLNFQIAQLPRVVQEILKYVSLL